MKKLWFTMLLMSLALLTHAQSKSVAALYEKYKGNDNFFHMDMAGSFFDFANGLQVDLDDEGMKAIAKSVERVKVFKLPVGKELAKMDFKALQKGLRKEKYELMMELSEKNSQIAFYSKGGNRIKDLVLLIAGEGNDSHLVLELQGEFESKTIANIMQ